MEEARETDECSYPTPIKAKIKGAIEFCENMGILYHKTDVFKTFDVKSRQGYEMLSSSSRRHHNRPDEEEARGHHNIISEEKIHEMKKVLENEGIEAKALSWKQLGMEVDLDVSERTIQRAMGTKDYHKCIACSKGWISPHSAEKRLDYAKQMLDQYSDPENWKSIRFSDEVHFGWGPQNKLHIIRKPEMRYCPDHIQERPQPKTKDEKRFHC